MVHMIFVLPLMILMIKAQLRQAVNYILKKKDVLRVFQCTNVRKNPEPDGISGQVLKNCATQLSGIFHSIFQASLSLQKIPTLWKTLIILSVPKKSRSSSPNDFHTVALTSHIIENFEKIIKTMIMTRTRIYRSFVIYISFWEMQSLL